MSPREAARIDRLQGRASRDIRREKHDAQTGDPASVSSRRMQHEAQRDANQERRISAGLADGSLTGREASRLERLQARDDRLQARAGRDGHVGAGEQRRIAAAQDQASGAIQRQRHDAQHRP